MFALIHQRVRNAMQSADKKSKTWIIEFPKDSVQQTDPLTGTSGSMHMMGAVQLSFETKEAAIAYAKANAIPYRLVERSAHQPVGRSYSDNFAFERKFPWTH